MSKHDDATYSAAWIDCLAKGRALGRSLIHLGEHASRSDVETLAPGSPLFPGRRQARLAVPWDLPRLTLNRWSVAAFNEVYFRRGASAAGRPFLSSIDAFFFPLDAVRDWNRIYGANGFVQHQCVVPAEHAEETLGEILERIAARGNASFLAVLKKLGPSSTGLMSFPRRGFTLALDFAIDKEYLRFPRRDRSPRHGGGRSHLSCQGRAPVTRHFRSRISGSSTFSRDQAANRRRWTYCLAPLGAARHMSDRNTRNPSRPWRQLRHRPRHRASLRRKRVVHLPRRPRSRGVAARSR